MNNDLEVTYTQKLDIGIIESFYKEGQVKLLWAWCVFRYRGGNSAGFSWKKALPNMSLRQTQRIVNTLCNMGLLSQKRNSVKVLGGRHVREQRGVLNRQCLEYWDEHLSSFDMFRAYIFAGKCENLAKVQRKIMKSLKGQHTEGVVKKNQIALSVISGGLGISISTAHRDKVLSKSKGYIKYFAEYRDLSPDGEKTINMGKENALNAWRDGSYKIRKVEHTNAEGHSTTLYVERLADTIFPQVNLSRRYASPEEKKRIQRNVMYYYNIYN